MLTENMHSRGTPRNTLIETAVVWGALNEGTRKIRPLLYPQAREA